MKMKFSFEDLNEDPTSCFWDVEHYINDLLYAIAEREDCILDMKKRLDKDPEFEAFCEFIYQRKHLPPGDVLVEMLKDACQKSQRLEEELTSLKAAKQTGDERVVELEEELKKYKGESIWEGGKIDD